MTHFIQTSEQLEALYGVPHQRSLQKQIDHIDAVCRRFIGASPFLLFATSGADGMDCSPRGDQPGFVVVQDEHTLLIPDRSGNNRIDSLRSVVTNPEVGLLFLIPGINQCLRVNGNAQISAEPQLLQRFAVGEAAPKTLLVVTVTQVFSQCSRAIRRAGLWLPPATAALLDVPSMGDMLEAHAGCLVQADECDAQMAQVIAQTLY